MYKVIKLLSILLFIPMTTLLAEPLAVNKKVEAGTSVRVNPLVYDRTVQGSMDEGYKNVFTALENNGYFILFESNIGKNLSHFETLG